MEFQEVMRDRFTAVIEAATARRVVSCMSGNQQDPDMICEVFVLSPTDLLDGHELPEVDGDRRTHRSERPGARDSTTTAAGGRHAARSPTSERRVGASVSP
jgi:hypothetical protein